MPKDRWKEYPCPYCDQQTKALVPQKNMVNPAKGYWDSAVQCPHCKKLYFKKIWPNGKVVIIKMSD